MSRQGKRSQGILCVCLAPFNAAWAKIGLSGSCLHGKECVYKSINVAVHDVLNVAVFIAGAVVLGEGVGHENVGADLAAPFDLLLNALDVAYLLEVLALFDLGKTCTEHVAAVFEVLEVASLDLGGHDDAGRDMGQANGG